MYSRMDAIKELEKEVAKRKKSKILDQLNELSKKNKKN